MAAKKQKRNEAGNATWKVPVTEVAEEESSVQFSSSAGGKVNDFAVLYRSGKHRQDDLTRINREDPNRKKKIIAMILAGLLVLLGAALAGFYFFINTEGTFSGDNILISAATDTQVSSGETVTITLTVENKENLSLLGTELTVQYPDGFVFSSANPLADNEAHNAWNTGDIREGTTKSVQIVGQILGDVGSVKNFSVTLSYMPENFSSEFEKDYTFEIALSSSSFNVDYNVPTKVVSGIEESYALTVSTTSSEVFGKVRLSLSIPEGLTVRDFSPAPTEAGSVWEFSEFGGRAEQVISWKGTIEAPEGEMKEVVAEVGYVDSQGLYHKQTEESVILFVVNPQLILSLSVDGRSEDGVASLGESIEYAISYRNESETRIPEATLSVSLTGDALDWTSIVDASSGTIAGNTITWNQDDNSKLANIEAGDNGTVSFSISLKKKFSPADSLREIVAFAILKSEHVSDLQNGALEVESGTITTKINSHVELRVEGRYYSDEFLKVGSGPIPPQVGAETTYRMFWYLQNGFNEVSGVTVTAQLASGITWSGGSDVSAGTITYDPVSNTVTWDINRIPANVGAAIPELAASFSLTVVPEEADLGKILILLGRSTFNAFDTVTSQNITVVEDMVTSEIPSDPQVPDQGEVAAGTSNTNANSNTNSNTNTNSSS